MSDEICGVQPAPDKGLTSWTTIAAPVERVWRALTDSAAASRWLAAAQIDLPAGIFELSGPWIPVADVEPATRLISYSEQRELAFDWHMFGVKTNVVVTLSPEDGGTRVEARHTGIRHSDLWVVALENLRLHCLGLQPRPYDFSSPMPGDLLVAMDIAAARARVFQALLDPQTLDRFWSSGASYDAAAGTLDYGWGTPPLRILELRPGEKLQVAWWEDEKHPETVVTWELADSGGRTRITLAHTGFAPGTEHDGLDIGWYGFLLALKGLLETGETWTKVDCKSFTVEPVVG
jgi:uncharacterized protein YndB with AHSA1/START domain